MALNNFDRFFANVRSRLSWASLCERDSSALPVLLQMFSTSQALSDQIIRNPSLFDVMRKSRGAPVAAAALVDELATEIESIEDDQRAMMLVNAFKQRQMARIIYGDITLGQRLSIVTRQISYLADAICEVTLRFAARQLHQRYGIPRSPKGEESTFVILALGKLGGLELNYSSDIDLIFAYTSNGNTDGNRSVSNSEYFERLSRRLVQLLTLNTVLGTAYRVDLRLRPEGTQGAAAISRNQALRYYENVGRTWERQAFVKARPVAGDVQFGQTLCQTLESSWIYRRYLTHADIAGIKALKRKIEKQALHAGDDRLNVKVGRGGIRDIEFAIQLLQLSLGAEFPEVRTGNTLDAIVLLEQVGGLTMQERSLLETHYVFLRKIEHRLQIMFDRQTHQIPDDKSEQRKLAIRLGFEDHDGESAASAFSPSFGTHHRPQSANFESPFARCGGRGRERRARARFGSGSGSRRRTNSASVVEIPIRRSPERLQTIIRPRERTHSFSLATALPPFSGCHCTETTYGDCHDARRGCDTHDAQ